MGEPAEGAKLIQKYKVIFIDALSGDPDFVLQHCHASSLLSQREYEHVSNTTLPSTQARKILDYIMKKDERKKTEFLELLKTPDMQETFPKLDFLQKLLMRQSNTQTEKMKIKRKKKVMEQEVPPKRQYKPSSITVTDKQLMLVTRHIGNNWKELGRVALDISTIKLDQIMEENPRNHREQVFEMLRHWSMKERHKATAAHLHSLLTQEEGGVPYGSIDFLLEDN